MAADTVKIQKDGEEVEVLRESLRVYEERGWTVVEDESEEPAQPEQRTTSQQPDTSGTGKTKNEE